MCSGPDDTCGDDATMCCGVATKGFVMNGDTISEVPVPNLAVCNKAPVDGAPAATKVDGTMTGADTAKTTITYSFPADGFSCFDTPAPPTPGPSGPSPPVPDKPTDPLVGVACKAAADKCGNADGSTSYCCGVATKGMMLGSDGKTVTSVAAPNIIICNIDPAGDKKPALDFEDYSTLDSMVYSAKYPADGFSCMSGAKTLVISAIALISAASMMWYIVSWKLNHSIDDMAKETFDLRFENGKCPRKDSVLVCICIYLSIIYC